MVRFGYSEDTPIIVTPDDLSDEDWAELEAEELDLFSQGAQITIEMDMPGNRARARDNGRCESCRRKNTA
jgi:hypothetical protein